MNVWRKLKCWLLILFTPFYLETCKRVNISLHSFHSRSMYLFCINSTESIDDVCLYMRALKAKNLYDIFIRMSKIVGVCVCVCVCIEAFISWKEFAYPSNANKQFLANEKTVHPCISRISMVKSKRHQFHENQIRKSTRCVHGKWIYMQTTQKANRANDWWMWWWFSVRVGFLLFQ